MDGIMIGLSAQEEVCKAAVLLDKNPSPRREWLQCTGRG